MVPLRNSYPIKLLRNIRAHVQWRWRGYEAPSPPFIKQIVLLRNSVPDSTWVETGTYLGDTTQFLARHSRMVYSLEPEPALFSNAKSLFKDRGNVQILNGTSEQILPDLLQKIAGNVSFWLDGHYSSGITFKGTQITPIADELNCIAKNLGHFNRVSVMIDDVRMFDPGETKNAGYPSLEFLVNWAKDSNLKWHIEHDIFVAKR